MSKQNSDGLGSKLANNFIAVLLTLIASCIGIYIFISGKQSIQDIWKTETGTTFAQPTPTPDLTNLYTYFPHPNIGSIRTYNFSFVYSQRNQTFDSQEQVQETGSYSETIRIVNDVEYNNGITIVGVEITGKNYLSECSGNFFWYVYDTQRLYIVCSKDYVYNLSGAMISNKQPALEIYNQNGDESLKMDPLYWTPFDIGKIWGYDFSISVENRVNKTIALGTFMNCFQIRFFAINYEEFRYLCPSMGVVAIEVFDHANYYSAELVGLK